MSPTAASSHIVAIIGATATGKTGLAIRVAERLGGEVLNADSRQIYRGMDVGTAKATEEERSRVRHWLTDVADPDADFSLGSYLDLAGEALRDCWSRGALPLLVGGTGQYVWALLEGWQVPRVPPDRRLREELMARAESEGPQSLTEELAQVDPESAARIDAHNVRRIVRALEVHRVTGRPLSYWRTRRAPEFAYTIIGLACEREELYRRIDARADAMIAAGLIEEVRGLAARGYGRELPAMSGIGYRQVCEYLAGELTLDEAVARMKTETHRVARKQHTWFRHDDDRIHWIDVTEGDPFPEALRIVESKLTPHPNGER